MVASDSRHADFAVISPSSTLTLKFRENLERRKLRCIIVQASQLDAPDIVRKLASDGVKVFISRGNTAKILKKIGADVVFPETEIGKRTAIRISEKLAEDILPLSEEFSIIQIRTPRELDEMCVKDIKIRERFGITLIAVVRDGRASGSVGPDTVLHADEILVLSGSNKDLDKFQSSFSH